MAMLALLLAVAIDAGPMSVPPSEATEVPPHTYLHPPTDGCDSRASSDEVVVCGSKELNERYRLRPNEDDMRFAERPVRAAVKIGNGTLSLAADPRKADEAQDDVYFKPRHSDLRVRFTIPF